MRNYLDAKLMAKQLRERLAEKSIELGHGECLELVASQFGYADWNMLAARIALTKRRDADGETGIRFKAAAPILRIFSRDKAREFYLDYLGFHLDWADAPLTANAGPAPQYTQISRDKLVIHLSEHHGDGSPGAACWITMKGIDAFHAELAAKEYPNMRPGIEPMPPRLRVMEVIDPFGNRLRFGEFTSRRIREDGSPV
ncbi:glyoxalase superfamily protein [Rhodanobacter aciditrophus]|uniref:glyoxalase superfamily protein n=1 Tax=Rhodanobacter aciditrophus TaxID=1623218 RepID=UPI003CE8B984